MRPPLRFVRAAVLATLASVLPVVAAQAGHVARASVGPSGEQARFGDSNAAALSRDGRFVAFHSNAWDLAPGTPGLGEGVYVRDRLVGSTERVSVSTAGTSSNNASSRPTISGDGRFVAFESWATNLVSPPTPFARRHVYLRDRLLGTTTLVSVTSAGQRGNGNSDAPALSEDGRYVAFRSLATNLTNPAGNGRAQILRWDRLSGDIVMASVDGDGAQGAAHSDHPSISADGSVVAFHSLAALEPRGRAGNQDIYLRDFVALHTELISVARSGTASGSTHSANPAISGDGRVVAFESWATDLLDDNPGGVWHVYVRDRIAGTTVRASVSDAGERANAGAHNAAINGDGTRVAFESGATNLCVDTNGSVDIFLRSLGAAATTTRVSVPDASLGDPEGDGWSWYPAVSADGGVVAFESWSTDLVAGDTNGFGDVFVHEIPVVAGAEHDTGPAAFVEFHGLVPNPARAGTGAEIRFRLAATAHVRVSVCDVQGRLVRKLEDSVLPEGSYARRWEGCREPGGPAAAGLYFVRLEAGRSVVARRLITLP